MRMLLVVTILGTILVQTDCFLNLTRKNYLFAQETALTGPHQDNSQNRNRNKNFDFTKERVSAESASVVPLEFDLHIYFDHISSKVNQEDYDKIVHAASTIQLFSNSYVVVRGHADKSEGSLNFCQKLSEERAKLVQLILVIGGVPSDKIVSIGDGNNDKIPLFSDTAGKQRKNMQRVDIFLTMTKDLLSSPIRKTQTITKKSNSIVRGVQETLIAYGYHPGPIDGFVGSKTKDAIQQFQKDINIPVTGCPDPNTLIALGLKKGDLKYNTPVSKQVSILQVQNNSDPGEADRIKALPSESTIDFDSVVAAIAIPSSENYTNNSWEDILKIKGVNWEWPYYESGAHNGTVNGVSKFGENKNPHIGAVRITVKGNRTFITDIQADVSNVHLNMEVFEKGNATKIKTSCDVDNATETLEFYKFERPGYKPVYFYYNSSWGAGDTGGVFFQISIKLENVLNSNDMNCKLVESHNTYKIYGQNKDNARRDESSKNTLKQAITNGIEWLSGSKNYITPPKQFMESKVINSRGMNSFFLGEYTVAQFQKKFSEKQLDNGKFPEIIGWTQDDNVYTLHATIKGAAIKIVFMHLLSKKQGDGALSSMYAELDGNTIDAVEMMSFVIF